MCAHACVVVLVDEVNREWQVFAVGAVLSLGVLMNKWRKVANMRHIFAGQVADADAVHDDDVDAKLAKRGSNDWSAKECDTSSARPSQLDWQGPGLEYMFLSLRK